MSNLVVNDLSTHFFTADGVVRAVDGVSFAVNAGESVGLVGESGSGKTVAGLSVLGLVDSPPGRIVGGSIRWGDIELLGSPISLLRQIRGRDIGMASQEPMSSLNPILSVGEQVAEVLMLHEGLQGVEARQRVVQLFARLGIPDPSARFDDYPHQFSGGMKQRVMLAIALACDPKLLIADEPTTALDVTVQDQIMEWLRREREARSMGLLLISHDLALVAENCDRVVVMYAGQVVEVGAVHSVLLAPRHPYTDGLVRSLPEHARPGRPLFAIPGTLPSPSQWDGGCRFRDRCDRASSTCSTQPPLVDDRVRCWFPLEPTRD